MGSIQSLRRTLLRGGAVAGIGALLCLAKPCWQAGAIEALFLICIPALAWILAAGSRARIKDWWTGVALECTAAIPLFFILYVLLWQAPFAPGNFTSLAAETSLFLFNLSDRFPSLLLACAPAPAAGILYAMLRAPVAANMPRWKSSLARWKSDRAGNPRRWFQFSLRTVSILFVVMTLWFGMILNEAREQREAVKALEALGWTVQYDWQRLSFAGFPNVVFRSHANAPFTASVNDLQDVFHNVEVVYYVKKSIRDDPPIREAIPHLQRLPKLKAVQGFGVGSKEINAALKTALPHCEVY